MCQDLIHLTLCYINGNFLGDTEKCAYADAPDPCVGGQILQEGKSQQ